MQKKFNAPNKHTQIACYAAATGLIYADDAAPAKPPKAMLPAGLLPAVFPFNLLNRTGKIPPLVLHHPSALICAFFHSRITFRPASALTHAPQHQR